MVARKSLYDYQVGVIAEYCAVSQFLWTVGHLFEMSPRTEKCKVSPEFRVNRGESKRKTFSSSFDPLEKHVDPKSRWNFADTRYIVTKTKILIIGRNRFH